MFPRAVKVEDGSGKTGNEYKYRDIAHPSLAQSWLNRYVRPCLGVYDGGAAC